MPKSKIKNNLTYNEKLLVRSFLGYNFEKILRFVTQFGHVIFKGVGH